MTNTKLKTKSSEAIGSFKTETSQKAANSSAEITLHSF